jgi:hypothetical protein
VSGKFVLCVSTASFQWFMAIRMRSPSAAAPIEEPPAPQN